LLRYPDGAARAGASGSHENVAARRCFNSSAGPLRQRKGTTGAHPALPHRRRDQIAIPFSACSDESLSHIEEAANSRCLREFNDIFSNSVTQDLQRMRQSFRFQPFAYDGHMLDSWVLPDPFKTADGPES